MWRSEDNLRKPTVSFYSLGTKTELRLLVSVARISAHSAIPGFTCLGLKIEKKYSFMNSVFFLQGAVSLMKKKKPI